MPPLLRSSPLLTTTASASTKPRSAATASPTRDQPAASWLCPASGLVSCLCVAFALLCFEGRGAQQRRRRRLRGLSHGRKALPSLTTSSMPSRSSCSSYQGWGHDLETSRRRDGKPSSTPRTTASARGRRAHFAPTGGAQRPRRCLARHQQRGERSRPDLSGGLLWRHAAHADGRPLGERGERAAGGTRDDDSGFKARQSSRTTQAATQRVESPRR